MPKSTLEHVQAQEAHAKAQLVAAQRKVKALLRQQRVLKAKAALQRQQVAGKLVEELGLPMDLDTLRPMLQALTGMEPGHRANGSTGTANGGLNSTPSLGPEEAHLAEDNSPLGNGQRATQGGVR